MYDDDLVGRHSLFNSQRCCSGHGFLVAWIGLSKDGLNGTSLALVQLFQVVFPAKI